MPSSSRTPSPGSTSPTGTPVASTAPASRAASAMAKLTTPMPPRTYPQTAPSPCTSPAKCMNLTAAVPGSLGPAYVPMIPWPKRASLSRRSDTNSSSTSEIEAWKSTSVMSPSPPSSSSSSALDGESPAQVSLLPLRSRIRIWSNRSS